MRKGIQALAGSRIKLQRAATHLADLKREATAFLASSPFLVSKEQQSPAAPTSWKLRIQKPVPASWAAIVGDIVHNVRAALDYLAWQLVTECGGSPSRDTAFPIAGSRTAFDAMCGRALAGLSASGLRLVRRLRPYQGGNRLLYQLHALDIIDKHRLLLVVGAAHAHIALKVRMAVPWRPEPVVFPPIAIRPADRQFPLADGAVLFSATDAKAFEDMHDEVGFAFELAFGDPGDVSGAPLIPTLEAILEHVTRIVRLAERCVSLAAAEQAYAAEEAGLRTEPRSGSAVLSGSRSAT